MGKFEMFIKILEKSVEKNGAEKPLTLGHLLNIAKLASTVVNKESDVEENRMDDVMNEIMLDKCGDRGQ